MSNQNNIMNSYFLLSIVIAISGYYGYYYLRSKLELYVIDKVIKKLDEMTETEEIKFQPFKRAQSAMVVFDHGGKQHRICIPYDNTKSRHMRRKKVYLIRKGDKIEITHKPGIPYLLSSKDMGGDKIIVEKDSKVVQEYGIEDVPNYLEHPNN